MQWSRVSAVLIESEQGYRVAQVRVGDAVRYTAWAPDIGHAALDALACERYAVGQQVPVRRACVGVYVSGDAARAACVEAFNAE